jgi:hypothetical protein
MLDKITATLTHYRRLDLLDKTITSFIETNTYPIDQFLIIDDSGDRYFSDKIIKKYSNVATIIVNDKNIGQRRSIDKLIQHCNNDFLFHMEEDWIFDNTNSEYILNSLKILKDRLDINQIHIRHQDDDPHPCFEDVYYVDNVGFRFLDPNFRGEWNGFSFNPGLRRKSDILKMFPNGLVEFHDEKQASMHTRQFNYKAVRLIDTVCKHIGWGRGTQVNGAGF